jgi:hypothetical protein
MLPQEKVSTWGRAPSNMTGRPCNGCQLGNGTIFNQTDRYQRMMICKRNHPSLFDLTHPRGLNRRKSRPSNLTSEKYV